MTNAPFDDPRGDPPADEEPVSPDDAESAFDTPHISDASFVYPTDIQIETVRAAVRDLGMPVYSAMLLAELTDEQIDFLDKDPDFNARIRFDKARKVQTTLQNVQRAETININSGVSVESRWLLSKLDRKNFGNGPLEIAGISDLPSVDYAERS
jgi:hypothetical protein